MNIRIAATEGFVALVCSLPALAQEIPVDVKGCGTAVPVIIDKAGDVTIGLSSIRGTADNVSAGGPFDKTTYECRAVWTATKSGLEFTDRCTHVDRDGDRVFTQASGTFKAVKTTIVAGTGKYEGISGRLEGQFNAAYPTTPSGMSGFCWEAKGAYSLKK
jgi:hypothetical protein